MQDDGAFSRLRVGDCQIATLTPALRRSPCRHAARRPIARSAPPTSRPNLHPTASPVAGSASCPAGAALQHGRLRPKDARRGNDRSTQAPKRAGTLLQRSRCSRRGSPAPAPSVPPGSPRRWPRFPSRRAARGHPARRPHRPRAGLHPPPPRGFCSPAQHPPRRYPGRSSLRRFHHRARGRSPPLTSCWQCPSRPASAGPRRVQRPSCRRPWPARIPRRSWRALA